MMGECNCACMPQDAVVLRCIPVFYYSPCLVQFSWIESLLATHLVGSLCCGVCVMCTLSFVLFSTPFCCSFWFVRCGLCFVHCCLVFLQTVFLPSSESQSRSCTQKLSFGHRLNLLISFLVPHGSLADIMISALHAAPQKTDFIS